MKLERILHTGDAHCEGEASRVAVGGVLDVPGETMYERKLWLQRTRDELRRPGRADQGRGRNATVVSPGRLDRSPCGTATCARMAILARRGLLADGRPYVHEGILSTTFRAEIVGRLRGHGGPPRSTVQANHRTRRPIEFWLSPTKIRRDWLRLAVTRGLLRR